LTALSACLIAACCELDFDAPVAKYRPSERQAAHQGQPPDKPSAGFCGWGDLRSFQITKAIWLALGYGGQRLVVPSGSRARSPHPQHVTP
jgi:hypothetical protein